MKNLKGGDNILQMHKLAYIIHGFAVKVAESHIVTTF